VEVGTELAAKSIARARQSPPGHCHPGGARRARAAPVARGSGGSPTAAAKFNGSPTRTLPWSRWRRLPPPPLSASYNSSGANKRPIQSEKEAKLAQKLGRLQPFLAIIFPPECVGQLASSCQPNSFLAPGHQPQRGLHHDLAQRGQSGKCYRKVKVHPQALNPHMRSRRRARL
jgi:hypothetical protein